MNLNDHGNWTLFGRRAFALLIDFLIFVSTFTILIRIFNFFAPGSDVREDAMQFFSEKDITVFIWTSMSMIVFLIVYMLACFFSKSKQTVGHRLAKIQNRKLNHEPMNFPGYLRVVAISCVRVLLIVVPGPFVGFYGGSIILSVFLLIWGLLLILPIPISKNSKVTLWEKLGNYRFVVLENLQSK